MASKALIEAVHKVFNNSKTPIPKTLAKSAVDSVFASISGQLHATGRFAHPGIGVFRVKQVAQRNGRNPATGATITIPAHNAIRYRAPKDWDLSGAKVFAGRAPTAALSKKGTKPAAKTAKK